MSETRFIFYRKIKNNRERHIVEKLARILSMLDYLLETKRKRHIAGGILMSISLLFGGLALTVLTLKTDLYIDNDKSYVI